MNKSDQFNSMYASSSTFFPFPLLLYFKLLNFCSTANALPLCMGRPGMFFVIVPCALEMHLAVTFPAFCTQKCQRSVEQLADCIPFLFSLHSASVIVYL